MINVGIIGLGRAGRFHLRSIKAIDHFSLKYIVDPGLTANDPIFNGLDVELLSGTEKVLNDAFIDAVIISSPTQFHFQAIFDALNAGKHVFTEKPLGKTTEEIKRCYEAARNNNRALHLGFQRRHDQNFIELKRSISEIGSPRIIKTSSRDNPQPSIEYLKTSGNIFHDMLIHDFDMLLYLLGLKIPQSIYATGHAYDSNIEILNDFDTVMVHLQYEDGLIVTIDTSRTAPYGYDQRIEIFSEDGMAIAENQRNHTVEIHNESGRHHPPINYSFPQRYYNAYKNEMIAFANGILNDDLFTVTYEDCLMAHLMADMAYESAVSGEVIHIDREMLDFSI